MQSKSDQLYEEAKRQGDAYSQLVLDDYAAFFQNPLLQYSQTERTKWAMSQLIHNKLDFRPWTVLDGGCGIGTSATLFAKQSGENLGHLQAIDMSHEALKVAKNLIEQESLDIQNKVSFEHCNFFDHKGGPYHLIYLHQVYEHIPDESAIFQKVHELLVPGGIFAISTPNWDRLINRLLKFKNRPPVVMDPLHLKEYTLADLKTLKNGFELISATGRMIGDEDSFTHLLSLTLKPIRPLVSPIAKKLAESKLFFDLGKLAPSWSWDLWVAWQKR